MYKISDGTDSAIHFRTKEMLGIYNLMSDRPAKTWQMWIKHIMNEKETFRLSKAAFFKREDGKLIASTNDFSVQTKDISVSSCCYNILKGLYRQSSDFGTT